MTSGPLEGSTRGLAWLIKDGTQASHRDAERVHFVHEFIKGNVSRQAYCQLLISLKHVYEVMEKLWDKHWEHPFLEPLYFPEELSRTAALEADCAFFGINLSSELPSKATLAYIERLHMVADSSPELLLSHAYVRYLGDLSGGQVLKKAAIRGLKLTGDGNGVQFYEFPRIPGKDFKKFKQMYRSRMDNLPVDAAQTAALVDEANSAFRLNMQIFAELDGLSAPVQSPKASLSPAGGCPSCPFAHLAGLPGVVMPDGHPATKTGTQLQRTNEKKNLCSTCPLSYFGRHAPKIASVVVPLAMAASSHAMLNW
mmetsp:Transcript_126871/g.237143  ORF Transcript_126871/g.237143 Transcript_126871/m.237143 type:complete len:311 (+) Transcript_126871:26-958(+)